WYLRLTPYSRRENRRIVSDVTVFATPKMSKKTSELFKLFHARLFTEVFMRIQKNLDVKLLN
ncbi:MAG: hypothetical protein V3U88_10345, partial [Methylococcales bacterium]